MSCFLCDVAEGRRSSPWYDQRLLMEPGVGVLVPGKGALGPGYVLAAPMSHVLSLRQAVLENAKFLPFVSRALDLISSHYGVLTFWEHGYGERRTEAGSACIAHAHLNIVAGVFDFPAPPNGRVFSDISSVQWETQDEGSYLLLGAYPGTVCIGEDLPMSQYYRRHWAAAVGRSDEWDYLLTRDARDIRNTIARLAPYSEGMDE